MSPKEDLREWIVDNFEVAIQENIRKKLIDYRKESLKLDEGQTLNFIEEVDIDILCEIIAENIKEGILNVVDTHEEEPHWNELTTCKCTEEEKEEGYLFMYDSPTPEIGETCLVSDGIDIWLEEWMEFDVGVGFENIDPPCWWMSLPELPDKEGRL